MFLLGCPSVCFGGNTGNGPGKAEMNKKCRTSNYEMGAVHFALPPKKAKSHKTFGADAGPQK